jgi:hypothetical protein
MTQILVMLEKWMELQDRGLAFDAIYIDFRKAFDIIPHR